MEGSVVVASEVAVVEAVGASEEIVEAEAEVEEAAEAASVVTEAAEVALTEADEVAAVAHQEVRLNFSDKSLVADKLTLPL